MREGRFADSGEPAGTSEALERYSGPNLAIRLWDKRCWRFSESVPPAYTIVFRTLGALRSLIVNPTEIALGEAYIYGDIDVEGDLFSVFAIIGDNLPHLAPVYGGVLGRISTRGHCCFSGDAEQAGERDKRAAAEDWYASA